MLKRRFDHARLGQHLKTNITRDRTWIFLGDSIGNFHITSYSITYQTIRSPRITSRSCCLS